MDESTEFDCPMVDGKLVSKALTYTSFWNLGISTVSIPADIKPEEILVKVKAVSINPIDVLLHRLSLFFVGSYRKVYGGDYAGIVVKAGEKAGYQKGDAVYGYRLAPFSGDGTFSQYIVINPKKVILCDKIPNGMLFEQAASLACAAATGYGVLKLGLTKGNEKKSDDLAHALKGKNVFIIGAGTSVGSYAVEFAKKYMDAQNVVVTCSSRSIAKVENLGADVAIDYTQGHFASINRALNFVKENGKFDLIVDCVRNEIFMDYMDVILKDADEGGAYCQVYGSKSMNLSSCSIFSMILPSYRSLKYKILSLLGMLKYNLYVFKLAYDATFAPVVQTMWKSHQLETPIDSVHRGWYGYEEAIHRVGSSKASGKVVCILE